jgi:hypothetical protein
VAIIVGSKTFFLRRDLWKYVNPFLLGFSFKRCKVIEFSWQEFCDGHFATVEIYMTKKFSGAEICCGHLDLCDANEKYFIQ